MAFDLQTTAGEDDGKEQGNDKLRDGADEPEDDGVPEVFKNEDRASFCRSEDVDVVLETAEFRADPSTTDAVIFDEGIAKGQKLGIKGEDKINDKKWN